MSSSPPTPATAIAATPAANKPTSALKPAILSLTLKIFQAILSFACLEMLHGQPAMKKDSMDKYNEIAFHGDPNNPDFVSFVAQMLQGLGRFRALFDEEKVVPPCFGAAIVGLHIEALGVGGCFLFRATLNNITSKISGDTITGVGKEVLRACKKYLAYWKDCLDVNGDFKSGLNEDSALLSVRKAMWAETNMATIVLEEEKSDEEPHHIDLEKDTGNSILPILKS